MEETDVRYSCFKSAIKRLNNKGYIDLKAPSYSDYKNIDRINYIPNVRYVQENKEDKHNIVMYIVSEKLDLDKLNSSKKQLEKKYKDIDKIYYIFGNCGIRSNNYTPTGHVRNRIKQFKDKIEIIENVLPFDITENINFPRFVYILNKKEEKDLLQKMKTEKKNLSKILDTDPLCAHYSAMPGQIIKITNCISNRVIISYRHVIQNL